MTNKKRICYKMKIKLRIKSSEKESESGQDSFSVLIKCPSWIAAKLVTKQIRIAGYFNPTNSYAIGSRNSRSPDTLFAVVCGRTSFFQQTNPETMFMILMQKITIIHIQSHVGMLKTGSKRTRQTATKSRSAMLSNLAPNGVAFPVFRAMGPSIMSEKPQSR